eukprot:m.226664 g.226664  ORF g.226664 m.226664 type:complete len:1334 (-) comp13866_c0_seq5:160-4161(-)
MELRGFLRSLTGGDKTHQRGENDALTPVIDIQLMCENVFACGQPWRHVSDKGARRVNAKELAVFLEDEVANNYLVFNLCPSSCRYDYKLFDNQVCNLSISSTCPSLGSLFDFCKSVAAFTSISVMNHVVVHCKDSKARTSICMGAYYLFVGQCDTPFEALHLYAERRGLELNDVLTDMRIRLLNSFLLALKGPIPNVNSITLKHAILQLSPGHELDSEVDGELVFEVMCKEQMVFSSKMAYNSIEGDNSLVKITMGTGVVGSCVLVCKMIVGVTNRLNDSIDNDTMEWSERVLFRYWFHTGFLPHNILRIAPSRLEYPHLQQSNWKVRIASLDLSFTVRIPPPILENSDRRLKLDSSSSSSAPSLNISKSNPNSNRRCHRQLLEHLTDKNDCNQAAKGISLSDHVKEIVAKWKLARDELRIGLHDTVDSLSKGFHQPPSFQDGLECICTFHSLYIPDENLETLVGCKYDPPLVHYCLQQEKNDVPNAHIACEQISPKWERNASLTYTGQDHTIALLSKQLQEDLEESKRQHQQHQQQHQHLNQLGENGLISQEGELLDEENMQSRRLGSEEPRQTQRRPTTSQPLNLDTSTFGVEGVDMPPIVVVPTNSYSLDMSKNHNSFIETPTSSDNLRETTDNGEDVADAPDYSSFMSTLMNTTKDDAMRLSEGQFLPLSSHNLNYKHIHELTNDSISNNNSSSNSAQAHPFNDNPPSFKSTSLLETPVLTILPLSSIASLAANTKSPVTKLQKEKDQVRKKKIHDGRKRLLQIQRRKEKRRNFTHRLHGESRSEREPPPLVDTCSNIKNNQADRAVNIGKNEVDGTHQSQHHQQEWQDEGDKDSCDPPKVGKESVGSADLKEEIIKEQSAPKASSSLPRRTAPSPLTTPPPPPPPPPPFPSFLLPNKNLTSIHDSSIPSPPPPPPPPLPPQFSANGSLIPPPPPPPMFASTGMIQPPAEPSVQVEKKIHWQTVPSHKLSDTIWNNRDVSPTSIGVDVNEFEKLFCKSSKEIKEKEEEKKKRRKLQATQKRRVMGVLDANRSRNVGIVLRRFKRVAVGFDGLIESVLTLDETVWTADELRVLQRAMPTKSELEELSLFKGDVSCLSEAERFFIAIQTKCPSFAMVVRSFILKLDFSSRFEDVSRQLRLVQSACEQLRTSKELGAALKLALELGNLTNSKYSPAHRRAQLASAISVSSLGKLREFKAPGKEGVTMLSFLALTLASKDTLFIEKLGTGLSSLSRARHIDMRFLAEEVDALEQTCDELGKDCPTLQHIAPELADAFSSIKASTMDLRQLLDRTTLAATATVHFFGEEEQQMQLHLLISHIHEFVCSLESVNS